MEAPAGPGTEGGVIKGLYLRHAICLSVYPVALLLRNRMGYSQIFIPHAARSAGPPLLLFWREWRSLFKPPRPPPRMPAHSLVQPRLFPHTAAKTMPLAQRPATECRGAVRWK